MHRVYVLSKIAGRRVLTKKEQLDFLSHLLLVLTNGLVDVARSRRTGLVLVPASETHFAASFCLQL